MNHWESKALLNTLRQLLKARKITYQLVAKKLRVSEQTIKRLFTGDDVPVSRLVDICNVVNVTFLELVELTYEGREQTFSLSEEQEEFFADNAEVYAVFDALLRGQTFATLVAKYKIPPRDLQAVFKQLESNGVLERGTSNSVKLLFTGTHNWLQGGPLQRKIIDQRNVKFVSAVSKKVTLDMPSDHFMTSSDRYVTNETLFLLIKELKEVFAGFRKQAQRDESFFPPEKLISVKWLACLAPSAPEFEKDLVAMGK